MHMSSSSCMPEFPQASVDLSRKYRWLAPWNWLRGRQEGEAQQDAEQTSQTGDYRSPSPAEAIPRGGSPSPDRPVRERQLSRTPINYPNMHSIPLNPGQVWKKWMTKLNVCKLLVYLRFCHDKFHATLALSMPKYNEGLFKFEDWLHALQLQNNPHRLFNGTACKKFDSLEDSQRCMMQGRAEIEPSNEGNSREWAM